MPLPVSTDSEQIRGRHFAGLFLFCFAPQRGLFGQMLRRIYALLVPSG